MVLDENEAGRYDKKALIHDKKWDVYMRGKKLFIEGGNSVEVSGFYGQRVV